MTTDIVPGDQEEALRRLLEEGAGLGDMDPNEGGISRIRIDHKKGLWTESLSGLSLPKFTGVITGIVKQRVMFPPKLSDPPEAPHCKSADFQFGRPNHESFPIQAYLNPPPPLRGGPEFELADGAMIPCDTCPFQKFGSHPHEDKDGPRCTEQIILLVMADFDDSGTDVLAFMTAQKSGLKPTRAYLAPYARQQDPAFKHRTEFSLEGRSFSGNDYSVPVYKRLGDTDRTLWGVYAQNYQAGRDFLRRNFVDEQDAEAKVVTHDEMPEF